MLSNKKIYHNQVYNHLGLVGFTAQFIIHAQIEHEYLSTAPNIHQIESVYYLHTGQPTQSTETLYWSINYLLPFQPGYIGPSTHSTVGIPGV
jgi:hypothetical protein